MTKTRISDAEAARRLDQLDPATAKVRDRSAVADIERAVADRQAADAAVDDAVRRARRDGVTWVEIASALGVSHQAAMQRFRPKA